MESVKAAETAGRATELLSPSDCSWITGYFSPSVCRRDPVISWLAERDRHTSSGNYKEVKLADANLTVHRLN